MRRGEAAAAAARLDHPILRQITCDQFIAQVTAAAAGLAMSSVPEYKDTYTYI